MDPDLRTAVEAIRAGRLVVYPTETVYGLGADARNDDAVDAVFEAKRRPSDRPLSIAFPSAERALEYVEASDLERAFMEAFLPGPVTVLLERRDGLPEALTAGREVVGIRVPDHDRALALLRATAPVTATSANVSGGPNARRVADLDGRIRARATAVLDAGETPGGESTVVDVNGGRILRRGRQADEIERWLAERASDR